MTPAKFGSMWRKHKWTLTCSPYLNLLKRLRSFGAEKLKPGHRNLGYFGTQPSCPIIKPIPKGSLFGQTMRFCVQNVTFWVCWTFAGWAAWCSSACVCQQTGSAQCNECSRDHWQAGPPLVAPTPLVSLALPCPSVSSSGLSTFSLSDLHDQGNICQNPTSGLKSLRMGRWYLPQNFATSWTSRGNNYSKLVSLKVVQGQFLIIWTNDYTFISHHVMLPW